jgi:hypothetical protein
MIEYFHATGDSIVILGLILIVLILAAALTCIWIAIHCESLTIHSGKDDVFRIEIYKEDKHIEETYEPSVVDLDENPFTFAAFAKIIENRYYRNYIDYSFKQPKRIRYMQYFKTTNNNSFLGWWIKYFSSTSADIYMGDEDQCVMVYLFTIQFLNDVIKDNKSYKSIPKEMYIGRRREDQPEYHSIIEDEGTIKIESIDDNIDTYDWDIMIEKFVRESKATKSYIDGEFVFSVLVPLFIKD